MSNTRKITLCGSTKFKAAFEVINKQLSLEGNVVYSVAFFAHADGIQLTDEQKKTLDEVHKKKIDNSDGIFVLDVDGYIGESTRSEIEHAERTGKFVKYLSQFPDLTMAVDSATMKLSNLLATPLRVFLHNESLSMQNKAAKAAMEDKEELASAYQYLELGLFEAALRAEKLDLLLNQKEDNNVTPLKVEQEPKDIEDFLLRLKDILAIDGKVSIDRYCKVLDLVDEYFNKKDVTSNQQEEEVTHEKFFGENINRVIKAFKNEELYSQQQNKNEASVVSRPCASSNSIELDSATILKFALNKHSSPYGKPNPETHAYINGFNEALRLLNNQGKSLEPSVEQEKKVKCIDCNEEFDMPEWFDGDITCANCNPPKN